MESPHDATYDVEVSIAFTVRFKTDVDTADEAKLIGLRILRDAELRSQTLSPDDDDEYDRSPRQCHSWNVEGPKAPGGYTHVWVKRSDEWRARHEPEEHALQIGGMAERLERLERQRAIVPEKVRHVFDGMIAAQRREIATLTDRILPLTAPLDFTAQREQKGGAQ